MSSRLTSRDNKAVPRVHVCGKDSAEQTISRLITRRNNNRRVKESPVCKKTKTYDIVNAGVNHRFSDESGHIIFQCNFGFVYGLLAKSYVAYAKTQYGIDVSPRDAEQMRDSYFKKYSKLFNWHNSREKEVHKNKQVRSLFGRLRHLPQIDSEDFMTQLEAVRQAINSGIQGVGSDLGVISLSRILSEIDKRYLYPRNFIHDAIYNYAPLEYASWGSIALKWYMESNPIQEMFGFEFAVPIVAEPEIGTSQGSLVEVPTPAIALDDITIDDLSYMQDQTENLGKKGLILPTQKIPPNNGRIFRARRRR